MRSGRKFVVDILQRVYAKRSGSGPRVSVESTYRVSAEFECGQMYFK